MLVRVKNKNNDIKVPSGGQQWPLAHGLRCAWSLNVVPSLKGIEPGAWTFGLFFGQQPTSGCPGSWGVWDAEDPFPGCSQKEDKAQA